MPRVLCLVSLLTVSVCSAALGEIRISFPLEGHYRPGRYMPVRVQCRDEPGKVTLSADAAIATQITVPTGADVIVPWEVVESFAQNPHWSLADGTQHPIDSPLRALDEDERLIAVAGDLPQVANQLFPGKKLVVINLDLSRPLLQPAAAWETLDAVILSESAAARLDDAQRQMLISCGISLAIHSTIPGAERGPWKRIGDYWVIQPTPGGPPLAIEPAAYIPTYNWQRGWPLALRRQIIFAALIFCMIAAGLSLLRWHHTPMLLVLWCGITAGLLCWWYSRQSPMLQLSGGVAVFDHQFTQYDLWTWESPLRAASHHYAIQGLTHAVFAEPSQIEQTHVELICDADGKPSHFDYHLQPRQSLAFLTRIILNGAPAAGGITGAEPLLRDFAQQLYMRTGDRIIGGSYLQPPARGNAIPLVVIDRPPRSGG